MTFSRNFVKERDTEIAKHASLILKSIDPRVLTEQLLYTFYLN